MTIEAKADPREVRSVQVKPEVRTLMLERGSARLVQRAEGAEDDGFIRIDMSFCSDTPVRQYWWGVGMVEEVLEHSDAAIRLDRARQMCPVRATSHWGEIVGVVEPDTFRIEGGKLRGTIKFSRNSEYAKGVAGDLVDEVLGNVSIQYEVHRAVLARPGTDEELPLYRVVDWELYHVAIVGEAADVSVGVGRSKDADPPLRSIPVEIPPEMQARSGVPGRGVVMPEIVEITPEARAGIVKDAQAAERSRQTEIRKIADRFRNTEAIQTLATKALEDGMSADDFRREAFDCIEPGARTRATDDSPAELGLGRRDIRDFSLVRAVHALAAGKFRQLAPHEAALSETIAQKLGREPKGMYIADDVLNDPGFIRRPGRAFRTVVTSTTTGADLVPTQHLAGSFIEYLYEKSTVLAAGATVIDGLVGDIDIPKRTGTATLGFTDENVDGSEDGTTGFGKVSASSKLLTGWVPLTRKMLMNGVPGVDNLVRMDLVGGVGRMISKVALTGAGGGTIPLGIQNLVGVNSVALGLNGGPPIWDLPVLMEQEVAADNADEGALAYMVNAKTRGAMKRQFIGVGSETVWDRRGGETPLNASRAFVTNQLPSNLTKGASVGVCSLGVYGNWAELLLLFWGALDIMPDPYALAKSGGLRLHVYRDMDVAVRHVESFCICSDITTN